MKKILIISTSPRKNSNSDALAREFARGAAERGHEVATVSLAGKNIGFCRGCLAGQKRGRCIMRDDADLIAEQMAQADVLVFATPIYYYEMSGQMKTMLDRANPMYSKDYRFREVYLLAAAAEDDDHVWARAASGLEGWIECFPKSHLAGVVFAGGVAAENAIHGHQSLAKAFAMGRNC